MEQNSCDEFAPRYINEDQFLLRRKEKDFAKQ